MDPSKNAAENADIRFPHEPASTSTNRGGMVPDIELLKNETEIGTEDGNWKSLVEQTEMFKVKQCLYMAVSSKKPFRYLHGP